MCHLSKSWTSPLETFFVILVIYGNWCLQAGWWNKDKEMHLNEFSKGSLNKPSNILIFLKSRWHDDTTDRANTFWTSTFIHFKQTAISTIIITVCIVVFIVADAITNQKRITTVYKMCKYYSNALCPPAGRRSQEWAQ